MDDVEVTVTLPVAARARAKATGKWHQGALTVPLTVRLPVVDARVVDGMVWGKDRFVGDRHDLYALVDRDVDFEEPLGTGEQFHACSNSVTLSGVEGCVVDGLVPEAVRAAVEVDVDSGAMQRFNRLTTGPYSWTQPQEADKTRRHFALAHPEGDLEFDDLDEDAVRSVLESHLVVDADGILLVRTPPPEAVVTRDFEIVPSVSLPRHTKELFRLPLGEDGLDAMGARIHELRSDRTFGFADTIGFPTSPVSQAADGADALGRAPDAKARMWMVHRFGAELTRFPDEARDALTPLRPALEGDDPEEGTTALLELIDLWRPHVKGADASRCAIVQAGLEHLVETFDRRRSISAAFTAF